MALDVALMALLGPLALGELLVRLRAPTLYRHIAFMPAPITRFVPIPGAAASKLQESVAGSGSYRDAPTLVTTAAPLLARAPAEWHDDDGNEIVAEFSAVESVVVAYEPLGFLRKSRPVVRIDITPMGDRLALRARYVEAYVPSFLLMAVGMSIVAGQLLVAPVAVAVVGISMLFSRAKASGIAELVVAELEARMATLAKG